MTRCILSLALVLTPAPITPRQEAPSPWPSLPPTVPSVAYGPPTSPWYIETSTWPTETSSVETVNVAMSVPPPSTEPAPVTPPPELTPIERAINRLAELGASPYQLRTFGCIAWYESKNDPNAYSRTADAGIFQINRIHAWRWAGRDIFDPVVNAEVAWQIYRESGWRAWTTHGLCNV